MKIGPLNISFSRQAPQVAAVQPVTEVVALRRELTRRTYAAAAPGGYNSAHWRGALGGDVNTSIYQSLPILRNRCRFEVKNNSWAFGATNTFADTIVGDGATLQVLSDDDVFNASAEERFIEWDQQCDRRDKQSLGQMIRLAGALQQCDSGEGFIVFHQDTGSDYPVKLKLLAIEGDRVATPFEKTMATNTGDGIETDEYGKVVSYWISNKHPGNFLQVTTMLDYRQVDASLVIHLLRETRPGQLRGVPLFTPALDQFAAIRDYAKSVMTAADVAARLAGVLQKDPELAGEPECDENGDPIETGETYEDFDPVDIEAGTMLTLPPGYSLEQFTSHQPATTYQMFVREKLKEIGRSLNMPYNVIAGDSSEYNYASGRLDKQNWQKFVDTYRKWLEQRAYNRIFRTWLKEALLVPGYIKRGKLSIAEARKVRIEWFWEGTEHVDPIKEAKAQEIRLKSGVTTLAEECAKKGKDWEKVCQQRAREREKMKELGLIENKDNSKSMENIARAVRSGVPIGVAEARVAIGLSAEPAEGDLLRFNDQDVLQYHVEAGILKINEIRAVLGLSPVPWGNVPVRKNGITPVVEGSNETEGDESAADSTENEETETE